MAEPLGIAQPQAVGLDTTLRRIRPHRRWGITFTLSSLFGVVTILCIWLAYFVRMVVSEERAVEAILEHGNAVVYDYEFDPSSSPWVPRVNSGSPSAPKWLRQIVGDRCFRDVVLVDIRRWSESRDVCNLLHELPCVRYVYFWSVPLTNQGLLQLSEIDSLEELYLCDTRVTAEGINAFRERAPRVTVVCPEVVKSDEKRPPLSLNRRGLPEDLWTRKLGCFAVAFLAS